MSMLSKILGIDKGLETVDRNIGRIGSGLDKLHFSDQEKSAASLAFIKLQMDFVKSQQSENSIRSVTRRVLAIMLFVVYLGLVLFIVGIYKHDPKWAEHTYTVTKELLSVMALAVVTFYFGYYAIASIVGAVKKKKEA